MTDIKKLRELAEMRSRDGYVNMVAECEAIIELLDRLERYREALEYYGFKLVPDSLNSGKTAITTDTGRIAREALEGGK